MGNFPEITMACVLRQSMFIMTGSKKQIRVFVNSANKLEKNFMPQRNFVGHQAIEWLSEQAKFIIAL